jgi:hypothetical protein
MRFLAFVSMYVRALREEPKLRAFAVASFVGDIGVAISAWASMLLMTNLFTSQRARASLMLPTLACFLTGTVVSGPLADWAKRSSLAHLARWRWRLVLWASLVDAAMLAVLLVEVSVGEPTIPRLLPYAMATAFTKTAFRPTRLAFSVDLLSRDTVQTDARGSARLDERGEPLRMKTHLLTMTSLIGTLSAASTFAGLVLGRRILGLAAGRYAPLFFAHGVMSVLFIAVVFLFCHPSRGFRTARLSDLVRDDHDHGPQAAEVAVSPLSLRSGFREFLVSLRDGVRFLVASEQRPLLILLIGALMVELVTESYDGKMIVKHVLGGSDESVRHAELAWSAVGMVGVAAVPALSRALGSIGRIFLVTMLLDGLSIAGAGHIAGLAGGAAIVPFTVVLGVDHTLTLISVSLTDLATNSASSARMRGRIAGTFTLACILGDIFVEGAATSASEAIGIPAMLVRVGLLQVVIVIFLAMWGGGRLWRFGLRKGARRQAAGAELTGAGLVAGAS